MADNFDLRKFLVENKLTKNAQLLKEEDDDNYKYFDEEGIGGFYMTTIDGVKIYSLEDSSIRDTCGYALEDEDGYIDFISIDVSGEPVSSEDIQNEQEILSYIADFIEEDINSQLEEEGLLEASRSMKNKMNEGSDYGYDAVMDAIADHFDEGSYEYDQVAAAVEDAFHNGDIDTSDFSHDPSAASKAVLAIANELGLGEYENDEPQSRYVSGRDVEEAAPPTMQAGFDMVNLEARKHKEIMRVANKLFPQFGGDLQNLKPLSSEQREMVYKNLDPANIREASYKTSKNSKEAQHLKKGDIIGSGDEVVSVSAGAKTPAGKVEVTLKTKNGKTKVSTWGKTTKVGLKAKETVKESVSPREAYLTRLVENALGLEGYGDDNVLAKLEKRDEELPERPTYSEGDEMAQETVIPSYRSIDELMKSIDHGTNEAAHSYKMKRMKEIAEALEQKVGSLEEGEGAEFVDTKKVKQMKKDIMTLRKQAEKLEKEYDKKFAKKEPKKEQK